MEMQSAKETFMAVLTNMSGHATNKIMIQELGWDKGVYLMVRSSLLSDGVIKLGRGQGGMVHIKDVEETKEVAPSAVVDPFPAYWR